MWTVVAVEKSVCCDIVPNKYCFRTRQSGGSTFPDSGSELSVVLVAAQALVAEVIDFRDKCWVVSRSDSPKVAGLSSHWERLSKC